MTTVSANGTGNHTWVDDIKNGLAPEKYEQIDNDFAEISSCWANVRVPDLGIRVVHEPNPSAGQWLTDFVAYAKKRSPMSPEIFHEVNGLFLLSAAIARRVALKTTNGNIYPNLFVLLVGPPGIVRKTGAINAAETLADNAGLLRLPSIGTTEALSIELSTTKQYNGLDKNSDPGEYEAWRKERALAAQRSLIAREASKLFESGKKDYMAQFRELLLEMYDCPNNLAFGLTVSRGRATVKNIYLSFLGDTTPAAMRGYFDKNAREWADGTFSRFNLLTFEERPDYQYFLSGDEDNEVSPGDLATRLHDLHYNRLPLPEVTMTPVEMDDEGNATRERLDVGPLTEKSVTLGAGVREAMNSHSKAIHDASWEAFDRGDEKLTSLYVRLHVTAIKIAMLLAIADWADAEGTGGIIIKLTHWERAVWISERWRRALHRVESLINRDTQASENLPREADENKNRQDVQKIYEYVKYGSKGSHCTNRNLQRKFYSMGNERRRNAIEHLEAEGLIVQTEIEHGRGKKTALAYKANK